MVPQIQVILGVPKFCILLSGDFYVILVRQHSGKLEIRKRLHG